FLTPGVQVALRDAGGNRVASGPASVAITLATGPPGATLSGGAAVTTTAGVAAFPALRLSAPGTGYRLRAEAAGLAPATSAPFDVTRSAGRFSAALALGLPNEPNTV